MKTRKNSQNSPRSIMLLSLFFLGSLVGCDACKPKPHGNQGQNSANPPSPEKIPTPITDKMIARVKSDKFLQARLQELKDGNMTNIDLIDLSDYQGDSSLHKAVSCAYLEAVQAFLDRGADVNVRDGGNCTPLRKAIWNKTLDIAMALVQTGRMTPAALNAADLVGKTAYKYANDQITGDPGDAVQDARWQALMGALKNAGADTKL